MITISTVTPVYSGSDYLLDLIEELEHVRESWKNEYPDLILLESIFVLDDPIDESAKVLKDNQREWMKIITLSKNSGQHAATMAGILYSVGDWIFTLDEDLQHRPQHFIKFLKTVINETCDICYAHNMSATHKSFVRDKCSMFFKKIVGFILGNRNIKNFNSFRLIRGEIGRSASSIAGYDAYLDIVLSWYTNKVNTISFDFTDLRNSENQGESGYSFLGLIKHAKRMLFTSNFKILRFGIVIGTIAFIVSLILISYSLLAWFIDKDIPLNRGWYSTFSSILFFGGLNSLLIGLLMESITKILLKNQGKPSFYTIERDGDDQLREILNTK